MKVLIIDNYDSFTYNLYQLIAEINGDCPLVRKNDELNFEEFDRLSAELCIISPGPGNPAIDRDFGICRRIIRESEVPLLGVCLGHQGIGHAHGARVIHAPEPFHGRVSQVFHSATEIFAGIPQGFPVVRYHSLMVEQPLPAELEKTGWTSSGILMALRHRVKPMWGVQFHPESICTDWGRQLLQNTITLAQQIGSMKRASFFDLEVSHSPIGPGRETGPLPSAPCMWQVYSHKLELFPDPEVVFHSLYGQNEYSFWLDSSRAELPLSRFSFLGAAIGGLSEVITYQMRERRLQVSNRGRSFEFSTSIFDYVPDLLEKKACKSPDLPFDFNCGLVGYFGYELKAECGGQDVHKSEVPDAQFILADRLIAFDHVEQCMYLVYLGASGEEKLAEKWFEETMSELHNLPGALESIEIRNPGLTPSRDMSQPKEEYIKSINRALAFIRDGESYEICLTNKMRCRTDVSPFDYYRHLRRVNPAPYAAFLRFGDLSVACSSPERFLKIDRTGLVESKPIKGTVARGQTLEDDIRLAENLRLDEKSRSENLMIVDLLRNDLGLVCAVGSVCVPRLMQVETYATVHQLVSTIRGRLSKNYHAVDCFRHAFPPGSMTGAPKIRTMEHIDQLEKDCRGIYSGCIGFFGLNGTADFNVVIRTVVFAGGAASFGVGGAIVALSCPEDEFGEIETKSVPMMCALENATSVFRNSGVLARAKERSG